ncbi:MAG: apolipoprotein N-acyltransferase [Rhodobacterales bacterium 12-64-8]|nr:MAG: apolipoprotein N-acyltransferase [Rhodobacterales bacterium 12-64-8]OYX45756.1 MAG: apolipoprotein N-acyltransferase [Alphaproteobacteria bacterium 32-64-14]
MTNNRSSGSPTGAPQGGEGSGAAQGNLIATAYLWVAGLQGWRALAFCAALGAVANLAFPPLHIWPAFAIALSGLVWSLDGAALAPRPGRAAVWRVAAFGFAYYLIGMHWIAFAFLVNPGAHLMFIWMPLIALPSILTAVLAGCVHIGFRFWCPGPARLVIFAVAFMFGEWVRGSLFGIGGLPWNLPGMIWAPGEAISQSASLWGIYGLSALTVIAMASPAALVDRRGRGTTASRAAPVIVAAIVFGALWGWGARRLSDAPADPGTGAMVRLIDVGTPQAEKHKPENAESIVRRYLELTGPATASSPAIVIWPEGALPYFLFEWDGALRAVSDSIGQRKLILGVPRLEGVGTDDVRAYNSLAVLSGDADVRGARHWYDKHMLVPFGEFMPFADLLGAIGLKTLQDLAPGGFAAGPDPSSVRVDGVPPFGPLICYEVIFPGLSPTGDDRPEWLVNISIDAWFGEFIGPGQHAAQARYRAIEEGLPMARVASLGETGMIDAYGRWSARGAPADTAKFSPDPDGWRSSVVDARIPQALPQTPYGTWRDGLFWVMLFGFNLGLFVLPRR